MRRLLAPLAFALLAGCAASPEPSRPPPPPSPSPPSGPAAGPPALPTQAPAASSGAPAQTAQTAPNPPRGSAKSHVETRSFQSAALGVEKRFQVYLPKGYDDSERRFAVVYLLHGLGGNEGNWVTHGDLVKTADEIDAPFIVVMPDGDDGFYVNGEVLSPLDACLKKKPPFDGGESPASYCVKTPAYDDYVTRDLIAHVDGALRTLPDRGHRAIAGLSMGGYGAMQLAMRHPDLFSAAVSHAGMVYLSGTSPPKEPAQIHDAPSVQGWGEQYGVKFRDHVKAVMGPDIDRWKERDPVHLAEKLEPGRLSLMLDCGSSDGFKFQHHARKLHEVLSARGIAHEYTEAPGGHDWAYWKARLPFGLKFLAAKVGGQSAG